MVAGGVPLVVLPAVARVAHRQESHHPVADDLGDDRRAGDRVDLGIAVDDVRVRADLGLEAHDPVAIDDHVIVAAEARDRPAHREVRRVVDVQLVDLADRRSPDADRHRPRPDDRRELLALGHRQGLGVADARDPMTARLHDHGRGDDGPAGRGHADLIDARDAEVTVVPEPAFVAEGRDDDGHRPSG